MSLPIIIYDLVILSKQPLESWNFNNGQTQLYSQIINFKEMLMVFTEVQTGREAE